VLYPLSYEGVIGMVEVGRVMGDTWISSGRSAFQFHSIADDT
jgi:hypothetical protein